MEQATLRSSDARQEQSPQAAQSTVSDDPLLADLAKLSFVQPTGGVERLRSELSRLGREAKRTGDTKPLDELLRNQDEFLKTQVEHDQQSATAQCDLIDALKGRAPSSTHDALWTQLLADLQPGLFADYALQALGNYTENGGPVHTILSETLTRWSAEYGSNSLYSADISRLSKFVGLKDRASKTS